MVGELDISGVFIPTLAVLMGVTYGLYWLLHRLLNRIHFYRLVWHRGLFNVSVYALLLGAIDSFSRYLMT